MRLSRLHSSLFALATSLISSSLLAAPPDPPSTPAPLEASGNQPDPTESGILQAPPPAPAPTTKPPVLEIPAGPPPPPPPPPPRKYVPPPPEDDEPEDSGWAQGTHFEFTMGFLAGQRSYTDSSFKFTQGTAEGIGGGGLIAPFVQPPFNLATMIGLRWETRLVLRFMRMTVGFDLPFTTYKSTDSTAPYDVSGTMRQVTVQSLQPKELRFGLGAEYAFKKAALFADIIGGVHWVDTQLAIDGYKAEYAATGFAFSGRVGGRAYVTKYFFVTASGELGLIGDLRWNAEFAVGFSGK